MIDQLKHNFKTFETSLNGATKSNWHELRTEAFEAFAKNGFPKPKDEEYRYTQIARALEKTFDFSATPVAIDAVHGNKPLFYDSDAIHVFIDNGVVQKDSLTHTELDAIEIMTLEEATNKYPEEIKAHFGKYANVQKDPFTALNTAFSYEGVFIKVTKNTKIERPVLLHYSTDGNNSISQSRNLILVEQGAEVSIIESHTSHGDSAHFSNHVSEIVVGANANFNGYKLQHQHDKSYHVDNTFISQDRDSKAQTYTLTLEGKLIRNNLNFALEDENCEAHMFGLYVVRDNGHVDNHTNVDHKMPNCYSNEIYKGILDDKAKGVFNGKIFVRQDAQKTNAFQSNKNILLTDTASINTKPQLEIWADDVSCSHGCTTGQLDEEQLFYLRSRGVSKSSATAMLLHAFVNDVLDKINISFLHNFINEEISKRLD